MLAEYTRGKLNFALDNFAPQILIMTEEGGVVATIEGQSAVDKAYAAKMVGRWNACSVFTKDPEAMVGEMKEVITLANDTLCQCAAHLLGQALKPSPEFLANVITQTRALLDSWDKGE